VHVSQCCERPPRIMHHLLRCLVILGLRCRAACALYRSSDICNMRELGSVASLSAMWLCTQPPCPSSWSIDAASSASSCSSLQGYEAVQKYAAGESASSKDTRVQLQQLQQILRRQHVLLRSIMMVISKYATASSCDLGSWRAGSSCSRATA
jgi:hypothetical protein